MRSSACIAVGIALAGCGGQSLTAGEASGVSRYEAAFASTVANGSRYGETLDGVDYIIELYREKPDAEVSDGRSMRDVVEDAANTLDPYRPDLVREFDRALGSP